MANVEKFTDSSKLINRFEDLITDGGPVICIFSGRVDEETGENWCGDCVVAKPAIDEVIMRNTKTPILYGAVTRDEWRGVETHPYRKHPAFYATGVPTMLLLQGGDELCRADEVPHFAMSDLMNMFVEIASE